MRFANASGRRRPRRARRGHVVRETYRCWPGGVPPPALVTGPVVVVVVCPVSLLLWQADVWVVVVVVVCVIPLLVLSLLPLVTGAVLVVVLQVLVLEAMAVGASAAPATPRLLASASAAAAVRTLIRVPS